MFTGQLSLLPRGSVVVHRPMCGHRADGTGTPRRGGTRWPRVADIEVRGGTAFLGKISALIQNRFTAKNHSPVTDQDESWSDHRSVLVYVMKEANRFTRLRAGDARRTPRRCSGVTAALFSGRSLPGATGTPPTSARACSDRHLLWA